MLRRERHSHELRGTLWLCGIMPCTTSWNINFNQGEGEGENQMRKRIAASSPFLFFLHMPTLSDPLFGVNKKPDHSTTSQILTSSWIFALCLHWALFFFSIVVATSRHCTPSRCIPLRPKYFVSRTALEDQHQVACLGFCITSNATNPLLSSPSSMQH